MHPISTLLLAALFSVGFFGPGWASSTPLAGSEWQPFGLAGDGATSESNLFVRFDGEGRVEGYGGCNNFSGGYELSDDMIAIGPLIATRMACPVPIMDLETRLLQALDAARYFQRDSIELSLSDGAGKVLVRFVQTDAD
jgi:heat shock protein HslJ